MTRALPSMDIDPPPPGTCCPRCAEPLVLTDFCGACGWRAPSAAAAQIHAATLRARTWQLGRGVQS